jgi:adenylate cyclase class 2
MEVILGTLGYVPHMIYEKYRTTYELYGSEIVLDEMPYGSFVEIEGTPDAIHRVREAIGLKDATAFKQNYAQLFENVKRNLSLSIHDLTFANFEGMDVPESAFA